MDKVIQAGPAQIEISTNAGVASLKASVSASLGGGQAAGIAKAAASLEIDLGAQQAADLGLGLLAVQFPALAGEIAALKVFVDAEIAKI